MSLLIFALSFQLLYANSSLEELYQEKKKEYSDEIRRSEVEKNVVSAMGDSGRTQTITGPKNNRSDYNPLTDSGHIKKEVIPPFYVPTYEEVSD